MNGVQASERQQRQARSGTMESTDVKDLIVDPTAEVRNLI